MGDLVDENETLEPLYGVFTDLGAAQLVPPNWIIHDLLPPGLVIIGAPPKSYKSTFEMAVCALVAGLPCKALPPSMSRVERSGPVLGFSAEASAGELRHMLEEGLKCPVPANESILICDDPFSWRLDDPDGQDKLLYWIHERDPRLVFIDPLRDFHAVEEKDSGGMNRILRPLQRWAKEADACVLVVHHTKKKEDESGSYSPNDLRGTSALFGMADGVLMLTPRNAGSLEIKATFKRAAGWTRQITMAAYGIETASELLSEVEKMVQLALSHGATLDEISEQVHISKARVLTVISKLVANGQIPRNPAKVTNL